MIEVYQLRIYLKKISPLAMLLKERTSPELLYLQSKWASLMSYGLTVNLLEEVLPLKTNVAAAFRHTHKVAERIENELQEEKHMYIDGCENQWEQLPDPGLPLTVGIDGGYVHARDGDNVRDLQLYMSLNAEHLLNWFHVTMRITVLKQMLKGLPSLDEELSDLEVELERIKWCLWHGNCFNALHLLEDMDFLLESESYESKNRKLKKLSKTVSEFRGYISNNRNFIPNYQNRYHYGETISTAFVESTVNEVVSKRMVKKQQMCWTKRGAHLMLQVRTKTLNNELKDKFKQWYPGFQEDNEKNYQEKAA